MKTSRTPITRTITLTDEEYEVMKRMAEDALFYRDSDIVGSERDEADDELLPEYQAVADKLATFVAPQNIKLRFSVDQASTLVAALRDAQFLRYGNAAAEGEDFLENKYRDSKRWGEFCNLEIEVSKQVGLGKDGLGL